MNVLPQILYTLQAVPIKIPPAFFASYRKACTDFVWQGARPRLSNVRLTTPKLKGGVGLPDIYKYHLACGLTRIVDWTIHSGQKDWLQLEQLFSPLRLPQLPWIAQQNVPADCTEHPLIRPSLLAFREACNKHRLSDLYGPMTPLRMNPDFTPGMHPAFLAEDWPHPTVQTNQCFTNGRLLLQSELASKINKDVFPFWTYVQIRHFFTRLAPGTIWSKAATPFEHICSSIEPQRHLISTMSTLLFSTHASKIHWANQQWERDLMLDLTDTEWEDIYRMAHKGSVNVQVQENAYKILSRWYKTPLKLHRINPALSKVCWRCNLETGSFLHIWLSCPKLQPFWMEVQEYISKVTTFDLEFTPAQFLLHHAQSLPRGYCKSLAMHVVNAARMCIPLQGLSPNPPSIADWFKCIHKTMEMEELIHQANDTPSKFSGTWACWTHFVLSDCYKNTMSCRC